MATDKKSFILYTDLIHTIESLEDIEAGKLFKHLLRYVNDLNPDAPDRIIQLVFEPIKQQLKRDLKDWEKTITGKSEGGKKSAEIRKNLKSIQHTLTKLKTPQHTSTNSTDNVSVNVTVNDNVNVINTSTTDFQKLFLSDQTILEHTCRITNCTDNGFIDIVKDFFSESKAAKKVWIDFHDCNKNFIYWLRYYKPKKEIEIKVPTPKYKLASDD